MPNPRSELPRAGWLASPPVVAVAGWLLPGAGYWLIGHRARALTVGITIVTLFFLGPLVGGVRAVQVPGYGDNGKRLHYWIQVQQRLGERGVATGVVKLGEDAPADRQGRPMKDYVRGPWVAEDFATLLREVGNKPWSICQVMAGPVAFVGGAWSVSASRSVVEDGKVVVPAAGVTSHSRINEIAVLYTAVAGLLNLMVVIDAAARAARQGAVPDYASSRLSSRTPKPEAA